MNLIEFSIVDNRSVDHGVLGKPALKDLRAVTSIHHLCMKIPTDQEIASVRGNRRGIRECYLNSIRKVEPRHVNVIIMDINMPNAPAEHVSEPRDVKIVDVPEKVFMLNELEPQVIELEPQAAPVEELESFQADPKAPPCYCKWEKACYPSSK